MWFCQDCSLLSDSTKQLCAWCPRGCQSEPVRKTGAALGLRGRGVQYKGLHFTGEDGPLLRNMWKGLSFTNIGEMLSQPQGHTYSVEWLTWEQWTPPGGWQGYSLTQSLRHCWRGYKLAESPWKTVIQCPLKLKVGIPYDLEMGYLTEVCPFTKREYCRMIITATFIMSIVG